MQKFIEEQWIAILVGILSGLIANNLPKIKNAVNWFFDKSPLYREWFHYYFNYDIGDLNGDPKFHEEKLIIKRRFWTKPKVISQYLQKGILYNGSAELLKNQLRLEMYDSGFNEKIYEFFPVPNIKKGEEIILLGLGLAEDFNGRPAMATCVLSTTALTEDYVNKLIKNNYLHDPNGRVVIAISIGKKYNSDTN